MRAVASCVIAMQTCGQRRPFKDWLRGRPLWGSNELSRHDRTVAWKPGSLEQTDGNFGGSDLEPHIDIMRRHQRNDCLVKAASSFRSYDGFPGRPPLCHPLAYKLIYDSSFTALLY